MSDNCNNEQEQIWRFTFGCGQEHSGKCQPIIGTFGSTRSKMFEMYGDKWAFQYSEAEWDKVKNNPDRFWSMEEELEVIKA